MGTNNMYWDISVPLSYNALFNMICGPRGVGKSYGSKCYVKNQFTKKGSQFIYMRRFKEELKDIKTFWNDIANEFPEDKLEVKGNTFLINGEEAGYAMALSTAKIKKSVPYPKVGTIIFDEFILDKGYYHYLPDEVVNFLEAYETIARMRDVKVFFLSNAITVVNPYYLYFNLNMPKDKKIVVKNDVLLQYVDNKVYEEAKSQTRFGKMISGTQYGDYAIHNIALRDEEDMIKQRPPKSLNIFTFTFKSKRFGVWWDKDEEEFYVSSKYDPNMYNYAFTVSDHKMNTILLKGSHRPRHVTLFLEAYKLGSLYFEDVKIAGMCREILLACL